MGRETIKTKKRPRFCQAPEIDLRATHLQPPGVSMPDETIIHVLVPQVESHDGDKGNVPRNDATLTMKVDTMDVLKPGDYRCCPIAMEDFDEAYVENLHQGACFVQGKPQFCVATLQCGHRFHALSILYHMVVNGMSCPVCR